MPAKFICDGCGIEMPQELIQLVNIKEFGKASGDFIMINNTKDTTWQSNLNPDDQSILIACGNDCAKKITKEYKIFEKNVQNYFDNNPEENN